MKLSIAFMTGVLAMAGVVYAARGSGAPLFFAGVVAVLVPGFIAVSSVPRIRSVVRFLTAFADAWEGKAQPKAKLTEHELALGTFDPLAYDVASALINQGVREAVAHRVAAQATKANREFDPAYRVALEMVPKGRRVA